MNITRPLFLLLFGLLSIVPLQATHYLGSELNYRCNGGCNYTIVVTQYFDCGGTISPTTAPSGNLSFFSTFGMPAPATALNSWTLVSDTEVQLLDDPAALGGTNCNGGSFLGVKKVVFERDYDLCSVSGSVRISFQGCCRNGAINNLVNSGSQGYEVSLDIIDPSVCSDGPEWLDPSISMVSSNSGFSFSQISMGASDPDGDSLAFSLDTVNTAPWTGATYAMGLFYAYNPLGYSAPPSPHIHPATGEFYLGSNALPPLGGYAINTHVREYRNGQLVSISRRDFSLFVVNVPTNSWLDNPYLSNFGGVSNGAVIDSVSFSTSVGNNFSFPFQVFSNAPGTQIDITWSQNLAGAQLVEMPSGTVQDTITGFNPMAEFRWTPTVAGNYSFNIKLRNDSQSLWGERDYTYVIRVDSGTTPPCNLSVDIGPDSIEICQGDFAQLNSLVQGGSAPYSYIWSTGETTPNIQVSVMGTYILDVSDANGCTAADTIDVEVSAISVDIGPDSIYFCDGDTVFFNPITTGGVLTYDWGPQGTTASILTTTTGIFHLTVTDANGCTASDTAEVFYSPYCVWPGDADNDLVADNNDLLALGLTYGDTGPLRPNASLTWEAQQGSAWTNNLPSGTNAVFCDTDGNGIVNDDDTLAISLNYGLTHQKGSSSMAGPGDALIYLQPLASSVGAGETLEIEVRLGTDTLSADSIYGLAFTVAYDNSIVDSSSAQIRYMGWLGTYGTDLLGIQKDFFNNGEIDGGLVRTDLQTMSGYGKVASLSIVMIDDIAGKGAMDEILDLQLLDVMVIGLDGEEIPVNTQGAQVTVTSGGSNSIDPSLARQLKVYPQPALNTLFIELETPQTWEANLYTLSGQQVGRISSLDGRRQQLSTEHLANGMYLLRVHTQQGIISRKIMITR
ncbi:MAG: T9SS type A sorting domain-containing protein [Bacteroidota bacterium]